MTGGDFSGDERAEELAEQIRAFWASRGCKVEVSLRREVGVKLRGISTVKSDLRNGWPPKLDAAGKQAMLASEFERRRGFAHAA